VLVDLLFELLDSVVRELATGHDASSRAHHRPAKCYYRYN